MKRETKAWLIILTPFFVGLLLGILIGSCMSRGSRNVAEEAAQEEEAESVQPEVQSDVILEDSELDETIPQKEKK